jgi:hypothetical protein
MVYITNLCYHNSKIGSCYSHHKQKIQSFELHRRHTNQPEIITFDELLARAEWLAEAEAN